MPTTLTITVNFSAAGGFSYTPSYTDATGTYTAVDVRDPWTIAFINNGHYSAKLQNAVGTVVDPQFDDVQVVLGPNLGTSKQCGSSAEFVFTMIAFPKLPTASSAVTTIYSWCQALINEFATMGYKDPKLGLSNTTGNTPTFIPVDALPHCPCIV